MPTAATTNCVGAHTDSLPRFFDRLDVRLRRLGRSIRGLWIGLPAMVKILAVTICVAALGYGAYYLIFG